jgi:hypothetical protein
MKNFALKALIAWVTLAAPGLFAQNLLLNGNFESGNLNFWTLFATPNGGLGPGLPNVISFDTAGTGTPSDAAQFQVGEVNFDATQQGGGFYQAFTSSAGQYVLSANIAARDVNLANSDAGTFSLSIDGISLANLSLGSINPSQTIRGTLGATVALSAGLHIFQFEITRGFQDAGGLGNTPLEYVDNLSVTAVPEPSGLCLFGLAALLVAAVKRKMGKIPGAAAN